MLFQAPQASQRPVHLPWSAPQDWQTYRTEDLATDRLNAGRGGAAAGLSSGN